MFINIIRLGKTFNRRIRLFQAYFTQFVVYLKYKYANNKESNDERIEKVSTC